MSVLLVDASGNPFEQSGTIREGTAGDDCCCNDTSSKFCFYSWLFVCNSPPSTSGTMTGPSILCESQSQIDIDAPTRNTWIPISPLFPGDGPTSEYFIQGGPCTSTGDCSPPDDPTQPNCGCQTACCQQAPPFESSNSLLFVAYPDTPCGTNTLPTLDGGCSSGKTCADNFYDYCIQLTDGKWQLTTPFTSIVWETINPVACPPGDRNAWECVDPNGHSTPIFGGTWCDVKPYPALNCALLNSTYTFSNIVNRLNFDVPSVGSAAIWTGSVFRDPGDATSCFYSAAWSGGDPDIVRYPNQDGITYADVIITMFPTTDGDGQTRWHMRIEAQDISANTVEWVACAGTTNTGTNYDPAQGKWFMTDYFPFTNIIPSGSCNEPTSVLFPEVT